MLALDGPFTPWIHAADLTARPRPWELPHRRLAHFLLVTSLDGPERIVVDDHVFTVREGDTYLIAPGQLHDLGSPVGSRPAWIHFDLRFDPARREHPHANAYQADLGERARFLQPSPMAIFGVDLPVLVPEALRRLSRDTVPRLIEQWRRGGPLDVLDATHRLTGLLLAWVEHAWRASGREPALDLAARFERAESLALRSLDTGFGVEDFAAAAGLSRSRFCAVFTRERGLGPGEWLRRQRLARAEALLLREDLCAAKVGALVGYADPTVFGRVFRAHTGSTPAAWRRARRN